MQHIVILYGDYENHQSKHIKSSLMADMKHFGIAIEQVNRDTLVTDDMTFYVKHINLGKALLKKLPSISTLYVRKVDLMDYPLYTSEVEEVVHLSHSTHAVSHIIEQLKKTLDSENVEAYFYDRTTKSILTKSVPFHYVDNNFHNEYFSTKEGCLQHLLTEQTQLVEDKKKEYDKIQREYNQLNEHLAHLQSLQSNTKQESPKVLVAPFDFWLGILVRFKVDYELSMRIAYRFEENSDEWLTGLFSRLLESSSLTEVDKDKLYTTIILYNRGSVVDELRKLEVRKGEVYFEYIRRLDGIAKKVKTVEIEALLKNHSLNTQETMRLKQALKLLQK